MKKGEKKANANKEKLRWTLLPINELEDVVKVLELGAKKYGDFDWKHVPNASKVYQESLFRHWVEYRKGNKIDDESGISHLAHLICCGLILMWHDKDVNELKYCLGQIEKYKKRGKK